jgi:hypothetical protein
VIGRSALTTTPEQGETKPELRQSRRGRARLIVVQVLFTALDLAQHERSLN